MVARFREEASVVKFLQDLAGLLYHAYFFRKRALQIHHPKSVWAQKNLRVFASVCATAYYFLYLKNRFLLTGTINSPTNQ